MQELFQDEIYHQEYEASKQKKLKRILFHSTMIMVFSFTMGMILYSGNHNQGQCRILTKFSQFTAKMFFLASAVRFIIILYALIHVFVSHGFDQLCMILNKLQAAEAFSSLLFFFIGCWLTEIKEQCASFGLLVIFVQIAVFVASIICLLNGEIEFVNNELVWNEEDQIDDQL